MLLRMKKYRLLSLVMGTVLVLCGCAGQSAPAAEEGAVSAESEAPTEESSAEEAQEAV